MTELKKPITRRAVILTDHRLRARNCDKVAVTLRPNGTIGFRAHKCRKEYVITLATAYRLAIQATERAEREIKKAARKAGKQPRRTRRTED
jgi:TfoX/Sxy family transcriptional regulator of competence genes